LGRYPTGYEAQIFAGDTTPLLKGKERNRTGSLYELQPYEHIVPGADAGEWFTLEVLARGSRITIKVNGVTTVDEFEDTSFRRGHLALQQAGDKTIVQFRKIEIKELPATQSDLSRLQGAWQAVAVEHVGKALTPEEVKAFRFEFTGNKMSSSHVKERVQSTVFTLDSTKDAKEITLKMAPDSTFSIEAIYRFEGDRLIVCMPMFGIPKSRPTKFALDPADPARALMTFVRSVLSDQEALQGGWEVVSAEAGGQAIPAEAIKKGAMPTRFLFKGNQWGAIYADGRTLTSTAKLSPEKNPAWIDVDETLFPNVPNLHGIYKLDGDRVTICICDRKQPRPTEFATKGKPDHVLIVARRAPAPK
jgi:uncharacterized protein (TIGR03067 family)